MASEKQYIELYEQAREMIFSHAPEVMNAMRDQAGISTQTFRNSLSLTMA